MSLDQIRGEIKYIFLPVKERKGHDFHLRLKRVLPSYYHATFS